MRGSSLIFNGGSEDTNVSKKSQLFKIMYLTKERIQPVTDIITIITVTEIIPAIIAPVFCFLAA